MGTLTVSARAVRVPLGTPMRISTRELTHREYVVVEARRHDGDHVGLGYAYAGTSGAGIVAEFVNSILAGVLAQRDPDDIVGGWEAMFQETLLIGRRGAALRAMSAIDIAVWDLAAKRAGLPLAVMLGGAAHSVAAYASGGYYMADEDDWATAVSREITADRARGFTDHKIKVGGLSVADDAKRVAAAVEAMEGTGRLALDANNAYASVSDACRAAAAFERAAGDNGLWWFEEPLSMEDVRGLAQVRQRIRTPIASGEISQTRHEFRELIELGAVDVLQPDAGVLGGVTEYMRVVRTAESFGVQVAPHWHANLHVHLAAASSTCITVEHFAMEKDIYNFERILEPSCRLVPRSGRLDVPAVPGIGIELDENAVLELAGGGAIR